MYAVLESTVQSCVQKELTIMYGLAYCMYGLLMVFEMKWGDYPISE